MFGLLGPNGAGKTTTVKVAVGLMRPSSGSVELGVDGLGRVGYLPENPYFYDYLSGREFLDFCSRLFGLAPETRTVRVEELLKEVGLEAAADTHLRKYSKGMLQRIGIAQALVNDPELLLLDEPMTGLDPIGRVEVKQHHRAPARPRKDRAVQLAHPQRRPRAVLTHRDHARGQSGLARRSRRGARRGSHARGLLRQGGDWREAAGRHRVQHVQGDDPRPRTRRDRRVRPGDDRRRPVARRDQPWGTGPHDEGLRPGRSDWFRTDRGRLHRRESGPQGGREAHRLRALFKAGQQSRLHYRQVLRPLRHDGGRAHRDGAFSLRARLAAPGDALVHGAGGRRDDLRTASRHHGSHGLLLDAGVGHPRECARHLRVRRRAAQPQRAGADAPRRQPRHRSASPG